MTHAHATLLGTLLELDAQLVKARARSLQVVDRNADVPEPAPRLLVARRVALELGVGFWCQLSCELFHS